jgi:hypothetical protein
MAANPESSPVNGTRKAHGWLGRQQNFVSGSPHDASRIKKRSTTSEQIAQPRVEADAGKKIE